MELSPSGQSSRFAFRDYRGNIADKTARRYYSREISVDNSIEESCETLLRLTIDCYISKIFSFLPFLLSFHHIRIAEISFCSYWKLLSRRGSAPLDFSSSTNDREKGRAAVDRRSSSIREDVIVDTARKRTWRTRTDHWAQVGYGCFRSDHLAIADGVPEPRRRDPAPGLRRNTLVRYNWVFTQSECQSKPTYLLQRPQFIQVSRMIFWRVEIIKVWLDLRREALCINI